MFVSKNVSLKFLIESIENPFSEIVKLLISIDPIGSFLSLLPIIFIRGVFILNSIPFCFLNSNLSLISKNKKGKKSYEREMWLVSIDIESMSFCI